MKKFLITHKTKREKENQTEAVIQSTGYININDAWNSFHHFLMLQTRSAAELWNKYVDTLLEKRVFSRNESAGLCKEQGELDKYAITIKGQRPSV